jgi:hypothetical protein
MGGLGFGGIQARQGIILGKSGPPQLTAKRLRQSKPKARREELAKKGRLDQKEKTWPKRDDLAQSLENAGFWPHQWLMIAIGTC